MTPNFFFGLNVSRLLLGSLYQLSHSSSSCSLRFFSSKASWSSCSSSSSLPNPRECSLERFLEWWILDLSWTQESGKSGRYSFYWPSWSIESIWRDLSPSQPPNSLRASTASSSSSIIMFCLYSGLVGFGIHGEATSIV